MKRALFVIILIVVINLASAELTLDYTCKTINSTSTSKQAVDKIFLETGQNVDIYIIDYYKNNWNICEKVLYVSDNPSFICGEIYRFILGNGYESNLSDLSSKSNVSYNIIENYRYNYDDLCLSYSPTLPKKDINKIFINSSNSCNEDVSSFVSPHLPLFHISVGKSCNNVNFFKYIFSTEKSIENYKITGIRLWFLVFIILLSIMIIKRRKR